MAIKGRPGLPGPCTRWKAAQSWVLSQGQSAQPCEESRSLLRSSQIGAKAEDLFPSSGALLGPAAASSAEPPPQCWNKKIPARRRSLFLSDPELRVLALHELSNQSDRHF